MAPLLWGVKASYLRKAQGAKGALSSSAFPLSRWHRSMAKQARSCVLLPGSRLAAWALGTAEQLALFSVSLSLHKTWPQVFGPVELGWEHKQQLWGFFLFRVKLNICSACSGCHRTMKARAGLGYLSCSGVLQLRFLPTDLIWAQRRFAHEIKNSYLPQKSALRRPWAACIGWSSYSFTWVIVLRDEER